MKEVRYDRQLRLWGEEGQASIGSTSVCLLGSSALATEILKCLVLAGVQSFCIVDDGIVLASDLGNNFFLHASDIGKKRAEATLRRLKELNPAVSGTWEDTTLDVCDFNLFSRLSSFSVVVASNLKSCVVTTIGDYLYDNGIPFISCRVFGLLGYIRVAVREHTVANAHDENPKDDLRLDRPLPEFLEMVNETDLATLTVDEVRHTPYIILYMKALQIFKEKHGDPCAFPSFANRQEIMSLVNGMRVETDTGSTDADNFDEAKTAYVKSFHKTEIPTSVIEILKDEKCSETSKCTQPFWLVCTGLKRFVARHGCLPLKGTLPDMTSDSKRYARLANIYRMHAIADANEVYELTKEVEQERGADNIITQDLVYRFCKTAATIQVQRGEKIELETEAKKIITELADENSDAQRKAAAEWMLLLQAADRFEQEKGRFPGTNGVPCTIDSADLKSRIISIVKRCNANPDVVLPLLSESALSEICRYGAAEPHPVSALIGGIVAQEVIKLATNQYIALDNAFLFDAHTQQGATFRF